MPLLVPGLHEAAAKTLAKRLHKALAQHSGVPSLTQLQTLLAQALGHADWHAAQAHWVEAPSRAVPAVPPVAGEQAAENVRAQFDMCMPQALRALQAGRNPAGQAKGLLKALVAGLDPLREATEAARRFAPESCEPLFDRLSELSCQADNPEVFPDPQDALARMVPLLERLHCDLAAWLYPEQTLSQHPAPQRLLLDGVATRGDWAMLEEAMAHACATPEDGWSLDPEASAAIGWLRAWWNWAAPPALQTAGSFLVHVFDDTLGALRSTIDRGAPPIFVSDWLADGRGASCAVFESPGRPLVVLTFLQNRPPRFVISDPVHACRVDGKPLVDTQGRPGKINVFLEAVVGLRELEAVLEGT